MSTFTNLLFHIDGRPGKTRQRHQLVVYVAHKIAGDKDLARKLNKRLKQKAIKVAKKTLGPIVPENGKGYSLEVGVSRRAKCDFKIPEVMVDKPEIVSVTPVSPNELLITPLKAGESIVIISNAKRELTVIKIVVTDDDIGNKQAKPETLNAKKISKAINDHFHCLPVSPDW